MRKEYDTYIFDLDGTLLDTLTDLAASCNYALQQHGMPQRTIDEVRQFVGNGVKKLMERAIPDGLANAQFNDVYQCFRQHYLEHGLRKSCVSTFSISMWRWPSVSAKALARSLRPIRCWKLLHSWAYRPTMPCMLVTAMWILQRQETAICLVSVCFGDFAIRTFYFVRGLLRLSERPKNWLCRRILVLQVERVIS